MKDSAYLLEGQSWAIAYSGFRVGQSPDGNYPSDEQILEDMKILLSEGFNLIRVYDSDGHGEDTIRVIAENDLPMKVLLGMWLNAEVSNHEGCAWLTEPIPQAELDANKLKNSEEVRRGIDLANKYSDVVVAVNVGNEALVDWNDHMVELDDVIAYVEQVKEAIDQPVTVADNYLWWAKEGKPLADVVDFIGVHTYPAWEHKSIDEAMSYTIENLEMVRDALPGKPMAILEAGWATTAVEFATANIENQIRYYNDLKEWAQTNEMTVFFFEAFDEPWKGHIDNKEGAEKHWGIYYVDRSPKPVLKD